MEEEKNDPAIELESALKTTFFTLLERQRKQHPPDESHDKRIRREADLLLGIIQKLCSQNLHLEEEGILGNTFTLWRGIWMEILDELLQQQPPQVVNNLLLHRNVKLYFIKEVDYTLFPTFCDKVSKLYSEGTIQRHFGLDIGGRIGEVEETPEYIELQKAISGWLIYVEIAVDIVSRVRYYGLGEDMNSMEDPNEVAQKCRETWLIDRHKTYQDIAKNYMWDIAFKLNNKLQSTLHGLLGSLGLKKFPFSVSWGVNLLLLLVGKTSIITAVGMPIASYLGILASGFLSSIFLGSVTKTLNTNKAKTDLQRISQCFQKTTNDLRKRIKVSSALILRCLETENEGEFIELKFRLNKSITDLLARKVVPKCGNKGFEGAGTTEMKEVDSAHYLRQFFDSEIKENDWILISQHCLNPNNICERDEQDSFINISLHEKALRGVKEDDDDRVFKTENAHTGLMGEQNMNYFGESLDS